MITPNDTLCSKDIKKIDITTTPTIELNQKEDKRHHPKHKHHKSLTQGHLYCLHCGVEMVISDPQYKMITSDKLSRQAKLQSRHMGKRARHQRAVLAGLARANKAGQTLKPSTIQKCTGRKIYREVASVLQI